MSLTYEQKKAVSEFMAEFTWQQILRRRRERRARFAVPPQQISDEVLDEYRNREFRRRSRAWFNRD